MDTFAKIVSYISAIIASFGLVITVVGFMDRNTVHGPNQFISADGIMYFGLVVFIIFIALALAFNAGATKK